MSGLLFICNVSETLLARLSSSASSALADNDCQAARGDYESLQGAYYRGTEEPYEQSAFVLTDLREASHSGS